MAKVAFTLPIDAVRGKFGGLVFSANRAGNYIKPFRQPAYVINEQIQTQRILLGALPTAWRALSDAQRTAWNTWAAAPAQARTDSLGNTYYINGWQQYVRIATFQWNLLTTLPTAAPTIAIPPAPPISAFVAWYPQSYSHYVGVTFAAGAFGAGDYLMVACSATPSPSVTAVYNGYRKILYTTTPSVTPSIESLKEDVIAFFGNLIIGGQLFIRCYRLTTECVPSLPSLASATIVETP